MRGATAKPTSGGGATLSAMPPISARRCWSGWGAGGLWVGLAWRLPVTGCLAPLWRCLWAARRPAPLLPAPSLVAAPSFRRVGARTELLVSRHDVARTWFWGPEPNTTGLIEPKQESPGGVRLVQY